MGAIESPFQGLVFNTSQREPVRFLLYLDSSRSFKFAKDWIRISSGIEIHWLHWNRYWNFTKIRAERLLKIFNNLWQESRASSKFCIYPSFSQTAIGSSCNFPQGDEIVQYSFTIKPCTELTFPCNKTFNLGHLPAWSRVLYTKELSIPATSSNCNIPRKNYTW